MRFTELFDRIEEHYVQYSIVLHSVQLRSNRGSTVAPVAHVIFPEKQFNLWIGHPPATAPFFALSGHQEGLVFLIVVTAADGTGDVDQRLGGRHADLF